MKQKCENESRMKCHSKEIEFNPTHHIHFRKISFENPKQNLPRIGKNKS
jgi:hypothetical protein